jgi:hypothetical protein
MVPYSNSSRLSRLYSVLMAHSLARLFTRRLRLSSFESIIYLGFTRKAKASS